MIKGKSKVMQALFIGRTIDDEVFAAMVSSSENQERFSMDNDGDVAMIRCSGAKDYTAAAAYSQNGWKMMVIGDQYTDMLVNLHANRKEARDDTSLFRLLSGFKAHDDNYALCGKILAGPIGGEDTGIITAELGIKSGALDYPTFLVQMRQQATAEGIALYGRNGFVQPSEGPVKLGIRKARGADQVLQYMESVMPLSSSIAVMLMKYPHYNIEVSIRNRE
ncbi:TPA: hypothetical protein HA265_06460 [Candidatus Woesearchaeota archaeon]|nr:hypothetical protein [Candidatus Woesearchaeota archaeon]